MPPIDMGEKTAEMCMKRSWDAAQIAADNYEFASSQSRLAHQSAQNFRDAMASRLVMEAGSGRTRGLDTTIAGTKASGGV